MTSLDDIRPIIDCFCQILSLYGFSTITSEIFLSAKFNQNQSTIALWRLIYEMICFDEKDFSNHTFEPIDQSEIVKKIKDYLYQRGYTYEQFMNLDENMRHGSQHLLVCIGWLIYEMKFLEQCMKRYLNSIANLDQKTIDKNDLLKEIQQTIQSNIKIRVRLEKIERDNRNDMSIFEKQLCEYPHLITQYLIELNKEYNELNLFIYWNRHENIFWKWMESVLDQPIVTEHDEFDCQYLEAEKEKFNAAIDTLDNVLIRLEQLWLSNNDHTSIEHDVSSIITSIDSQISSLFNQLLNSNRFMKINSQ